MCVCLLACLFDCFCLLYPLQLVLKGKPEGTPTTKKTRLKRLEKEMFKATEKQEPHGTCHFWAPTTPISRKATFSYAGAAHAKGRSPHTGKPRRCKCLRPVRNVSGGRVPGRSGSSWRDRLSGAMVVEDRVTYRKFYRETTHLGCSAAVSTRFSCKLTL